MTTFNGDLRLALFSTSLAADVFRSAKLDQWTDPFLTAPRQTSQHSNPNANYPDVAQTELSVDNYQIE